MEWDRRAGYPPARSRAAGGTFSGYIAGAAALLLLILNIILTSAMPSDPACLTVLAEYPLTLSGAPVREKDSLSDSMDDYKLFTETAMNNLGSGVRPYASFECGAPVTLDAFVAADKLSTAQFVTDIRSLPLNTVGYFPVEIMSGGEVYRSILIVSDTIAPSFSMKSAQLWLGQTITPEDMIVTSVDATEVSFWFEQEPAFAVPGTYDVTVIARDMGNNTSAATAVLTIVADTEPPVITGVTDRTVYIGDTVQYKENITATDNRDGEVEVSADIRGVNPNEEGTYTVTYTATDSTGLTTTATAVFTFSYTNEDRQLMKLEELLDPIAESLFKEDMTERQKAKAIYNWVRKNVNYVGTSDKSSWYACALEGLTTKNGDCYTYFALSKALLTRAGLENVDVIRKDSAWHPRSKHWWNMVKVDGSWYHFDATPRSDESTFFLVTTRELLEYSNTNLYSHDFDPADYPQTP